MSMGPAPAAYLATGIGGGAATTYTSGIETDGARRRSAGIA